MIKKKRKKKKKKSCKDDDMECPVEACVADHPNVIQPHGAKDMPVQEEKLVCVVNKDNIVEDNIAPPVQSCLVDHPSAVEHIATDTPIGVEEKLPSVVNTDNVVDHISMEDSHNIPENVADPLCMMETDSVTNVMPPQNERSETEPAGKRKRKRRRKNPQNTQLAEVPLQPSMKARDPPIVVNPGHVRFEIEDAGISTEDIVTQNIASIRKLTAGPFSDTQVYRRHQKSNPKNWSPVHPPLAPQPAPRTPSPAPRISSPAPHISSPAPRIPSPAPRIPSPAPRIPSPTPAQTSTPAQTPTPAQTATTNYTICQLLAGPPRQGDHIVYKILEMDETYCPVISGYKEMHVVAYDPPTQMVTLKPFGKQHQDTTAVKTKGRFHVHMEDGDEILTNDSSIEETLTVPYRSLIDARLLPSSVL